MGVEDNGGAGTRTETADRPPAGDRTTAPPPDDPGSSSRPSRLESRARAREAQQSRAEGVQETGSGGGAAVRRDGLPGSSQAAGEAGKPEAAARTESGQGGQRDEQPRSRDNGAQTGGGTSTERDRPPGQAAGRETDTRTEPGDRPASSARQYTLPADNPGSPGQASRSESRARAREAQEQRKAQDVQNTGGQTTGERGDRTGVVQGETDDQNTGTGGTDSTATERDTREPRRDGRGPSTGGTEREDGRGQETRPAGTETAADGGSGGEASGGRDRPASQPPVEAAGGSAPEAGRPPDRGHGPLPRQDAAEPADRRASPGTVQDQRGADGPGETDEHPPGPAGEISGPQGAETDTVPGVPVPRRHDVESAADTEPGPQVPDEPAGDGRTSRPEAAETPVEQPTDQPQDDPTGEQPAARDQGAEQSFPAEDRPRGEQDGTQPGTETGKSSGTGADAPAVPRQDETNGQGSETRDARAGSEPPDGEVGDRRTTDSTPAPSQETGEAPRTHEASDGTDGDRGRKAQNDGTEQNPSETNETNPKTIEPADESIPPSRDSRQSSGSDGPGRDLAPHEASPVETEPSRFTGRVRMSVDSDGRPVLPDRDPVGTEVGTRGRGEFGSPENDPADRDPRKEDSEHLSRRRELRRGIFDQPGDVKKSVDTFADPIRNSFDRVQPTGQHTGVHNNMDQFKSPDHPLQAGNIVLTAAGVTIIALEGMRHGAKVVRQLMRRVHDNHR